MTEKQELNSSVYPLAKAIREVFNESMQNVRVDIREDTNAVLSEVGKMESRLSRRMGNSERSLNAVDKNIDMTNKNKNL